jgi:hypothetical protein
VAVAESPTGGSATANKLRISLQYINDSINTRRKRWMISSHEFTLSITFQNLNKTKFCVGIETLSI